MVSEAFDRGIHFLHGDLAGRSVPVLCTSLSACSEPGPWLRVLRGLLFPAALGDGYQSPHFTCQEMGSATQHQVTLISGGSGT